MSEAIQGAPATTPSATAEPIQVNPAGGSVTPPPQTPTTPQWYDSFTPELKGYAQNKQWRDMQSVVESYRNLEKLNGAPEKLVKLPDSAEDKEAWSNVYAKLGRPESKDKYDLAFAEDATDEFKSWAKDVFFETGLSAEQGKALAEKWTAYGQQLADQETQKFDAEMSRQQESLKREWGAAYKQNVDVAKQGAKALGLDDQTIDSFDRVLGTEKTLKLLHKIGTQIGEDKFIDGSTKGGGGFSDRALSPEQASVRKTELMKDDNFVKKYISGDIDAKKEMSRLNQFIAAGGY